MNNEKDPWTIEISKYVRTLNLEKINLVSTTNEEIKRISLGFKEVGRRNGKQE